LGGIGYRRFDKFALLKIVTGNNEVGRFNFLDPGFDDIFRRDLCWL
jgi:hypothetical protein